MDSHFHDKDTAITAAEDFLHFLLEGNVKFAMNACCKDELMDPAGNRTTLGVMEEGMREFGGKIMTFIDKSIEVINYSVEMDYAIVHLDVRWDGLMANTLTRNTFSGIARIKMKRSPYEGWDVVQATVPGWNT